MNQNSPKLAQDIAAFTSIYALCVIEPIFRILSKNTAFLIDRRWSGFEMWVAMVLLIAGIPAIASALFRILSRMGEVASVFPRIVNCILLGVLFQYHLTQSAVSLDSSIQIFMSVGVMMLAYFLMGKWSVLSDWLAFLRPILILIPMYYIITSSLTLLLQPEKHFFLQSKIDKKNPIVMVVFDELPLTSLINGQFEIEAKRFPNFAKLAATSTWFRRATTVSDVTHLAVPALLTGLKPEAAKGTPFYSFHPVNLFSLFGESHRLFVSETLTQLCPVEICGASIQQNDFAKELEIFFDDLWILMQHLVLPDQFKQHLPTIHDKWSHFSGAHRARSENLKRKISEFVAALESSSADLYYLHINLPHQVFSTLPDGAEYPYSRYESATGNNDGYDPNRHYFWSNQHVAKQAYQRHLLQTGYADLVLGNILDALNRSGRFDESYVVVTADHGIAFGTKANSRFLDSKAIENFAEVLYVPLFVKLPNQGSAQVLEVPAQLTDVLPTLVEQFGLAGVSQFDGRSLFSMDVAERKLFSVVNQFYQTFNFPPEFHDRIHEPIKSKEKLFSGEGWQGVLELNKVQSGSEIPTSDLKPCTNLKLLQETTLSSARVLGEIASIDASERQAQLLSLVLQLNGQHQFATQSYSQGGSGHQFYSIVFDAELLRSRHNVWRIYNVLDSGEDSFHACEIKP